MVRATPAAGFEGPLSANDDISIQTLRAVLERHGFTGTAVPDALGTALPSGKSPVRDDLPLYLRRLAASSPINTLVKLFVLDRWVEEDEAVKAFAPLAIDRLRAMGLLKSVHRDVCASVRLSAYDGLILAHDACDEEGRSLQPDHVLDVNPATIALSNLTVRRPVSRALEIGTGCGVLSLMAARHAVQVVATDTNPRALNLAQFNAAINGVTNVKWRRGNLFEPVAGERFDLIFSNPPSVISPDSQFIFRDSGRRGDALCKEIARRAPQHLNDGGFATVLINWAIRPGEEWSAPLRRWVDHHECDRWLMMSATHDPLTYAAMWNRTRDRDAYTAGLDRWMRYFDELGLDAIGMGAIVLRKGDTDKTWVRADRLTDGVTVASGHHIERLFEAQDLLASFADDQALLAQYLMTAPDLELQQNLTAQDGTYAVDAAEIRLKDGLPIHGSVDNFTMQLLARCDGRRPLREIAVGIASAAGTDFATFSPACADIARRLIAQGFLVALRQAPAVDSSSDWLEGELHDDR